MGNDRTYWFGILPHVYYVKKGVRILLYNTQNGSYIVSSDTDVIALAEEMHLKKNLGIIELTQCQLQQPTIARFVQESKEKNICKLQERMPNSPKPVQLMPVLNLQRDVEKLKQDKNRSVGEGIMDYLTDVTVILNEDCSNSCLGCGLYDKQFFHCSKGGNCQELAAESVIQFLKTIRYAPIRRLSFTGGDIFSYRQWNELRNYLVENGITPCLGVHYLNVIGEKVDKLKDYLLEIFVTFPMNEKLFLERLESLDGFAVKYLFSVASEDDCSAAETTIQKYNIVNYEFRPFFDGHNLDFFEKEVFLTRDDIASMPVEQRVVFAHQKMNTNFFGQIVLLSNGDVKANPYGKVLGNIHHDHISNMLEKELVGTDFWRNIRNRKPCLDCLFQFICPSPSNYETVIDRANLCTLYNE